MGRILKRVPLDFDWPLKEIWKGYLNPHRPEDCPHCRGTGSSEYAQYLENEWFGWHHDRVPNDIGGTWVPTAWQYNLSQADVNVLLKNGRLMDLTHRPRSKEHEKELIEKGLLEEKGHWTKEAVYTPTPEEVNKWATKGFGHDAINRYYCIKARCKREKMKHTCDVCKGSGNKFRDAKHKRLYNNWKSQEPPEGKGYQLWENTSEGSPITPVFKTLEELCEYAAENCSTFGHNRATKEEWGKMLKADFVCHKEGSAIFI